MQPTNNLKKRPIVGGPNSPTQGISRLLEKILTTIVSCLKTYIKDDWDFIRKLQFHIDNTCVLASYNVVSLYASIPHDLGLEAISYWIDKKRNLIPKHFIKAFILEAALFTKQLYLLTEEIFKYLMHDCFVLWLKNANIDLFRELLYELHHSLKFTVEKGKSSFDAFVQVLDIQDVSIILHENDRLETDMFYRETNSHSYLDYLSHHSEHTEQNLPIIWPNALLCLYRTRQRSMKDYLVSCMYLPLSNYRNCFF